MSVRDLLRKAEILPSLVTRHESLEAGFSFGFLWKFCDYPFELIAEASSQKLGDEAEQIRTLGKSLGIEFTPDQKKVNRKTLAAHIS